MDELTEELRDYTRRGTPAERRIARYFIEHFDQLKYETAASIADRLDLSPMTVGRFLRALGVQSPDALLTRAARATGHGEMTRPLSASVMPTLLRAQADAVSAVHALTGRPDWYEAVRRLNLAEHIFIAGYQGVGGIVRHFTDQLSLARDRVVLVDGQSNACLEQLTVPTENALLILVDCGRVSTRVRNIAGIARSAGYHVLLITDQPSARHADSVDWLMVLPRGTPAAAANTTALLALLDLLVASVTIERGASAPDRVRKMGELRDVFLEFARH